VIQVGGSVTGSTQFAAKWTIDIDEIDQCITRSKLGEPELTGASLQPATEDILIETDHPLEVRHAQDDVVDTGDIDWIGFLHVHQLNDIAI
jgi:hypothetical protein